MLCTYRVGGHPFVINMPEGLLSEMELSHYAPFLTDFSLYEVPIFRLNMVPSLASLPEIGEQIADLKDENGRMCLSTLPDSSIAIDLITNKGDQCCNLRMSQNFKEGWAWIGGSTILRRYALDTALMLMYTFASSGLDTLLLHASVIEHDGIGYIFLGKSGTGKSTHSRLWIENISGVKLLNDDNPVVRIIDGEVLVYGTPWSGKTHCYLNRRVRVGGIVRLHQTRYNSISRLNSIKAYAALLPACSCMKWNHAMSESVHNTICRIIAKVPVYNLDCLPDAEAVFLCHNTITEK